MELITGDIFVGLGDNLGNQPLPVMAGDLSIANKNQSNNAFARINM